MTDDHNKSELEKTIQNLSGRQDLLKDDMVEAKKEFDSTFQQGPVDQDDDYGAEQTHCGDIDLFNDNVRLLISVFRYSRFDECIQLLLYPQRFLLVNMVSGFMRGIGFGLGLLLILGLLAYVLVDIFPGIEWVNLLQGAGHDQ